MSKMKSDTFDSDLFETRLESLKDTQEGIQQMSSWCLQQRHHHKKIVSSWLNVFKKVRVEHRLVLFYLANDVIQYSKRKRYEFVESWATALQRATTMVRDEKVKGKILRIFNIWEQREIYSEEYISDLNGLLNINPPKRTQAPSETSDDFQNTTLIANIRDCVELSNATDLSFKKMPKAPNCDIENIKHQLKDKSHSEDVEKEIERYMAYVETYNKNLQAEIKSRKSVLSTLDSAIKFYSNQRGEVKVVVSAYKNFGSRIKLVKKKLDEISPNLPSPIPSPDINAPSPEPDADLQLPDEHTSISMNMFKSSFNGYSSYLDGKLPFDINDFKNDETRLKNSTSSAGSRPIEVIATRPDVNQNESFNSSVEYYKPESISAYSASSNVEIPGLSPMPVPPVQSEYTSLARSAEQYGIIPAPHPPVFGNNHNNNNVNRGYNPMVTPYSNDTNFSLNNQSSNGSYNGGNNVNHSGGGMPLMPPPMPPSSLGGPGGGQQNSSDEFNSTWDMNMSWTQLDSSNASSNSFNAIETPVSPPHFERKGHTEEATVTYEHSAPIGTAQDVDHRQLHLSAPATNLGIKLGLSKEKSRQLDIDHRNLISLTGSPSANESDISKLEDKDFRSSKIFGVGDVDYRTIEPKPISTVGVGNMKPPPLPPNFGGFGPMSQNKKSSSPQKSSASSSSESQKEDTGGGSGYDPADMVVDMDMSDEDLEDIFREVNEETEEQPNMSQSSSTTDVSTTRQSTETAGDEHGAINSNNSRPALLETPQDYPPQSNIWDQSSGPMNMQFPNAMGMDNIQEQQQDQSWNALAYRGGSMYPPQHPSFPMPQHMQQQQQEMQQQFSQFPPQFIGGERGGGGRGRGRGWTHSPQNPFRNSQRPPRGGGSPYFNRGGRGGGGIRGSFRGKFRGNSSWI